jgi:GNAT superfamily N-acetyltransferase
LWLLESGDGRVLAIAEAYRADRWHEVALLVVDGWQRKGLGTLLMSCVLADLHADGAETIKVTVSVEALPVVWGIRRRLGLSTEESVCTWGQAEVQLGISDGVRPSASPAWP